MHVERHTVEVTTDASGDAVAYTPNLTGRILAIRYVKDGSTPFDNTVDFTITAEETGEAILSASNVTASSTYAPRQATHGVDGAASLYAAGGEPVEDYVALANDRVKIVIAQGGATKGGVFHIIVG